MYDISFCFTFLLYYSMGIGHLNGKLHFNIPMNLNLNITYCTTLQKAFVECNVQLLVNVGYHVSSYYHAPNKTFLHPMSSERLN